MLNLDFDAIKKVDIELVAHKILGSNNILPSHGGKYVHYKCTHPSHSGKAANNEKGKQSMLNKDRNTFFCNGCPDGKGSVIDFVMHYNNVNNLEAAKIVAEIGGIKIEETASTTKLSPRAAMIKIAQELWDTHKDKSLYHDYWYKTRGLSDYTLKLFKPGIAPGYKTFTDRLLKMGYTADELKNAGTTSQKGNDIFWKRVMLQTNGNVIGRAIDKASDPRILVGSGGYKGFFNEKAAYNKEKVIVSEGLYDTLSDLEMLNMAGLTSEYTAIGTHGTNAYVPAWFKRLKDYGVKELYILTDTDPWFDSTTGKPHAAGQKCALKIALQAAEYELKVFICKLPEGIDPNDLLIKIRNGESSIADFTKILNEPLSPLEFATDYEAHFIQISSFTGKIKLLDKIGGYFKTFGIPIFTEEWEFIAKLSNTKVDDCKEYLERYSKELKIESDLENARYYIGKLELDGLKRQEILNKLF